MKKFLLFLMVLGLTSVYAQDFDQPPMGPPREKIEELERLKLLETLNLDEETAIRFFARRNKNKQEVQGLIDSKEAIIDEMEKAISSGDKKFDYQKRINQLAEIEDKMLKSRNDFIASLDDLLTKEQIAKVIVFEDNFFKQVRDTLIKRGRGQGQGQGQGRQ